MCETLLRRGKLILSNVACGGGWCFLLLYTRTSHTNFRTSCVCCGGTPHDSRLRPNSSRPPGYDLDTFGTTGRASENNLHPSVAGAFTLAATRGRGLEWGRKTIRRLCVKHLQERPGLVDLLVCLKWNQGTGAPPLTGYVAKGQTKDDTPPLPSNECGTLKKARRLAVLFPSISDLASRGGGGARESSSVGENILPSAAWPKISGAH